MPARDPRPGPAFDRGARPDTDSDDPDDDDEPPSDPVDPADPVVSANATTGIAANPAPTPNATANAPTRPTYRAYDELTPPAGSGKRPHTQLDRANLIDFAGTAVPARGAMGTDGLTRICRHWRSFTIGKEASFPNRLRTL